MGVVLLFVVNVGDGDLDETGSPFLFVGFLLVLFCTGLRGGFQRRRVHHVCLLLCDGCRGCGPGVHVVRRSPRGLEWDGPGLPGRLLLRFWFQRQVPVVEGRLLEQEFAHVTVVVERYEGVVFDARYALVTVLVGSNSLVDVRQWPRDRREGTWT